MLAYVISEIAGVHRYLAKYQRKGHIPEAYDSLYWLLLLPVLYGLDRLLVRRRVAFISAGGVVGYVLSSLLYHWYVIRQGNSYLSWIAGLPVAAAVKVVLMPPLVFLAPVLGMGLFALDLWLYTAAKEEAPTSGSGP